MQAYMTTKAGRSMRVADVCWRMQAYITTKALNEFDPAISGVNWRQKLESQRAAVLV
jgi:hypothetical protein